MRKILFVLLMPMTLSPAFAQTVKKAAAPKTETAKTEKPTKEATMDWLGSKMKERLKTPRQFVSYNKGIFVYKIMYSAASDYCTMSLDLNKVTGMSAEYSPNTYITGTDLLYTKCEGNRGNNYATTVSIGGTNYQEYTDPFDFRTDNSLAERVTKAFKSLIEYNSSKKADGEAY